MEAARSYCPARSYISAASLYCDNLYGYGCMDRDVSAHAMHLQNRVRAGEAGIDQALPKFVANKVELTTRTPNYSLLLP